MHINFYQTPNEIKKDSTATRLYLITEDIDFMQLPSQNRIGSLVPHIITNNTLHESGILEIIFDPEEAVTFHLFDMSKPLQKKFKENSTLIMFADALTQRFELFTEALNATLTTQSLFGSGVGSRSFIPMPVIFEKDTLFAEHVLIAEIDNNIQVGVQHGWEPLYGPLVVTKTEGTIIKEINHEPAYKLYARTLQEMANVTLKKDDFFNVAKAYPLGILSYAESEFVVRDPLGPTDDEGLLLINSIPENETVYIMQGQAHNLINSAQENASLTLKSTQNWINLLFDCISRVLYMENEFEKELQAISTASDDTPCVGITSLGEITNVGFESVKIFNKTNLLGVINNAT
ncbi:MAG TPA: hypothetical protein ENK65_02505 [Helicobacteraceae bacterium]|nr:hypothetical protein [Helicobacteraceae bacterium]